jgi:hypothetical protein
VPYRKGRKRWTGSPESDDDGHDDQPITASQPNRTRIGAAKVRRMLAPFAPARPPTAWSRAPASPARRVAV